MARDERNDRVPEAPGAAQPGGEEGMRADTREQTHGADVVERPDRSRIQESEDDGALGLTRTGQDG